MFTKLKILAIGTLATFQKSLTLLSYVISRARNLVSDRSTSSAIVVGPFEVAFIVKNISDAVPNSISVNLGKKSKEEYRYTHSLPQVPNHFESIVRAIYGPWLLGRLISNCSNFLYVGRLGFLNSVLDERSWEYSFLKSKGVKVSSYLVGSDIRSPLMMSQLQSETGEENIGTYQFAGFSLEKMKIYEKSIKDFAEVINEYSDHIFTAKFDQASYLRSDTHPFMYFCPDSLFDENFSKFENIERFRIVHAPTNPTIKGTNLVRAAIRKLELEGYDFEYREIQGMKNQDLQDILKDTHILLNEFYGFMPGVLAVEGMAKCCVVLTRADHNYEKDLGIESSRAWVTTPPYAVYDNLKLCLDGKISLKAQAQSGYEWACSNALASKSGERLLTILNPF